MRKVSDILLDVCVSLQCLRERELTRLPPLSRREMRRWRERQISTQDAFDNICTKGTGD